MRKLVFILLISSNCLGQKNIRPVSTDSIYEAFGIVARIKTDTILSINRIGKTHTLKGNPYYRKYSISSDSWSDTVRIANDSLDSRDVSGGMMDNDSGIIFYARNHTDVYHSRDIYIQRFDTNGVFTSAVLFNWSGFTKLQGGFPFNKLIKGDSEHEYFLPMYQANDTGTKVFRIDMIHTTDCFNTYSSINVYSGTIPFAEPSGANIGNGKMIVLCRNNISGTLTPFESSNHGNTWVRRNPSNLYWYIGANAEMSDILVHDTLFDIIYECRDANLIAISKNNSSSNFGLPFPVYNQPETYSYNLGAASSNQSLGYPVITAINDSIRLITYYKQFNANRANMLYTKDDLKTDPGCNPSSPVITVSSIKTTSFRIDINNYSDKQKENIRWMEMDLAYNSLFTNIVTCKYRIPTSGAYPAVPIKNIKMTGFWDWFNVMAPSTNYWLRIRACNYKGCSDYSIVQITTL